MDITAIEKELRALLSLIERWQEQGYSPAIERDIALSRVRSVYDKLMVLTTEMNLLSEVKEVKIQEVMDVLSGRTLQIDDNDDNIDDIEQEDKNSDEQAQEENDGEKISEQERRFIHDLFCNDDTFYNQEIHKLSLLSTMDDVLIYIGEKYAWSPDNASAQEFVELQSKRFQ